MDTHLTLNRSSRPVTSLYGVVTWFAHKEFLFCCEQHFLALSNASIVSLVNASKFVNSITNVNYVYHI